MRPYLALITPLSRGDEHPDHELPGGGPGHISPPIYHPGHPDHGRPVDPGFGRPGWRPTDPGFGAGGANRPDNSLPGSGAHPWFPGHGGDGNRPDNSLPDGPQPKAYAGVEESEIPPHPPAPDPEVGEWVLVALGDRTMAWAWLDKTPVAQPK